MLSPQKNPPTEAITPFELINPGFAQTFRAGRLTVGLVAPIEAYPVGAHPTMAGQSDRIILAEQLGFAAVWLRDIPFEVPSFGDVGQVYDPFVYLGMLAGRTDRIALGVASIILPLRHPAHVAKAAASVDALSRGRLILGVASGDRPEEFPAMNATFSERGARFRDSVEYIRRMGETAPEFKNTFGSPGGGIDMAPKPAGARLPLLVTGGSQQDPDWIAGNADGWMTYPRNVPVQGRIVSGWRDRVEAVGQPPKPLMQSLYIDLVEDPDAAPRPIHLGFQSGVRHLRAHLEDLEGIGVNHVALNLRFNQLDTDDTLKRLADEILPRFATE